MKTVIDLFVPKSWQELPDKELRFVFRLVGTMARQKCGAVLSEEIINRSYKLYENIKDETGNKEQVVGNS